MTDAVTVEGLPRLLATLKLAAIRIRDMRSPGEDTARFVSGRGRAGAPHRSGRLSASVRETASATEATISSGLPYANRTHWGYRRYSQPAQPFLASVVWNNERLIVRNYAERVDEVVGGVRGK